jgi:hypothetical protein
MSLTRRQIGPSLKRKPSRGWSYGRSSEWMRPEAFTNASFRLILAPRPADCRSRKPSLVVRSRDRWHNVHGGAITASSVGFRRR